MALTLTGFVVYIILRVGHETFYKALQVRLGDLGLGYDELLSSTGVVVLFMALGGLAGLLVMTAAAFIPLFVFYFFLEFTSRAWLKPRWRALDERFGRSLSVDWPQKPVTLRSVLKSLRGIGLRLAVLAIVLTIAGIAGNWVGARTGPPVIIAVVVVVAFALAWTVDWRKVGGRLRRAKPSLWRVLLAMGTVLAAGILGLSAVEVYIVPEGPITGGPMGLQVGRLVWLGVLVVWMMLVVWRYVGILRGSRGDLGRLLPQGWWLGMPVVVIAIVALAFNVVLIGGHYGNEAREGVIHNDWTSRLVSAGVWCVEASWIGHTPPPFGLPKTLLHLGEANGQSVLYEPGAGPIRVPVNSLALRGVPEDSCSLAP